MNRNIIVTTHWSNPDSEDLYRALWPGEPGMKEQYENGMQCYSCEFYAQFNHDFGLCCNPESRHALETVFEHFTCPAIVPEHGEGHSFTKERLFEVAECETSYGLSWPTVRRVYVDTSVFGGVFDEEFREQSEAFFELVRKGIYIVVISEQTEAEIESAPENVRKFLNSLPESCLEKAHIDKACEDLASEYMTCGIVGPKSIGDAHHVAVATVARVDLILSWNFKHLVRYDRICRFNEVNVKCGFGTIDIRSPREVVHAGDQDV